MSKEGLEVLARMTDSKIQIKEVVEKFLLITYDLPRSEAGNKARQQFLIQAKSIGAVQFTESVYMMPWGGEAERLALSLAKTAGGEVIVWSQAQPLNKQEEVTASYDNALRPRMVEISERLDKIGEYKYKNRRKMVLKMLPKTEQLMANMEAAIARRGSEVLAVWLELLKQRYTQVVR